MTGPSRSQRPLRPASPPGRRITALSQFTIPCPLHGNAQWRHIRDTSPAKWRDVVEFEAAIRKGNARANATGNHLLGQAFLHRSRVPLDQAPIDHVTAAERAAHHNEPTSSGEEPEKGVSDGCSPWACRGEADAELTRGDLRLAS